MTSRFDCEYAISMRLGVYDPAMLWDAAAAYASLRGRMDHDTIVDTIGPRDDPQLGDCITMLLAMMTAQGCTTTTWQCEPCSAPPPPARVAETPATFGTANPRPNRRAIGLWHNAPADPASR